MMIEYDAVLVGTKAKYGCNFGHDLEGEEGGRANGNIKHFCMSEKEFIAARRHKSVQCLREIVSLCMYLSAALNQP